MANEKSIHILLAAVGFERWRRLSHMKHFVLRLSQPPKQLVVFRMRANPKPVNIIVSS
jgi:hypothetical protein